ncbi:MAG: protein translocase subunit SecF [Actinobacteria bacterium]|nr:MAG: protein translocase subunit SecF [Actinomycetota bacterium]
MMSFAQWGNALYSGEKSYGIVAHRKRFVYAATGIIIVSLLLVAVLGLNRSIEFTGGSQYTILGVQQADENVALDTASSAGVSGDLRATTLGLDGVRLQTETLSSDKGVEVREALAQAYGVDVESVEYSAIGPSWGKDVTRQALLSLGIFLALVTLLMTIYFRSWTMSVSALVALLHDVALTVAFFAVVRVEVSPATVIGFLTILGYSLYDTVVVFDKVRELTVGVYDQRRRTFGELVNLSVNQTMVRSINTSIVALLPVGAILFIGSFLLGAGTLIDISLALFVGMIVGTYSSIFIAPNVLVSLEERRARTRDHTRMVENSRKRAAAKSSSSSSSSGEDAVSGAVVPGRRKSNRAQPRRKKRS